MRTKGLKFVFFCLSAALFSGCWWYSFSGTSIPPSVRTIAIAYIDNKAPRVNPALSNLMTEQLKDKFTKLTRLEIVDAYDDNWDLKIEGNITGYDSQSIAVTANEVAAMERLTVTVKMSFQNKADPSQNFENKQFAKFSDYPSTKTLDEVESGLIQQIVEELIEEIFNAAVASNW